MRISPSAATFHGCWVGKQKKKNRVKNLWWNKFCWTQFYSINKPLRNWIFQQRCELGGRGRGVVQGSDLSGTTSWGQKTESGCARPSEVFEYLLQPHHLRADRQKKKHLFFNGWRFWSRMLFSGHLKVRPHHLSFKCHDLGSNLRYDVSVIG